VSAGTGATPPVRPRLADPVQFLAFGLGSGCSPRAPGTMGSLAAIPPYFLFAGQAWWVYAVIVLASAALGVWICGVASKRLRVHDHPGIVWDEFVGMWITLFLVPVEPLWIAGGFIVFRIFDIAKPWPVGWLDQHTKGGFGIMIDDVAAGVLACITLQLALHLGSAA
jgi:phosphatidylglycerophosphatase A